MVYGYELMLLFNKVVVVANTGLMLLGLVAYGSMVDLGYDPGAEAYALGGFWPTFVLASARSWATGPATSRRTPGRPG